ACCDTRRVTRRRCRMARGRGEGRTRRLSRAPPQPTEGRCEERPRLRLPCPAWPPSEPLTPPLSFPHLRHSGCQQSECPLERKYSGGFRRSLLLRCVLLDAGDGD